MKKTLNRIGVCLFLAAFFWCGTLISDRQRLHQEVIRLHVVANSDSENDQHYKMIVKDAVTSSLQKDLQNMLDVTQAKQYLQEKLPYIQSLA
jgi:stage II sporulation protein R